MLPELLSATAGPGGILSRDNIARSSTSAQKSFENWPAGKLTEVIDAIGKAVKHCKDQDDVNKFLKKIGIRVHQALHKTVPAAIPDRKTLAAVTDKTKARGTINVIGKTSERRSAVDSGILSKKFNIDDWHPKRVEEQVEAKGTLWSTGPYSD